MKSVQKYNVMAQGCGFSEHQQDYVLKLTIGSLTAHKHYVYLSERFCQCPSKPHQLTYGSQLRSYSALVQGALISLPSRGGEQLVDSSRLSLSTDSNNRLSSSGSSKNGVGHNGVLGGAANPVERGVDDIGCGRLCFWASVYWLVLCCTRQIARSEELDGRSCAFINLLRFAQ